MSRIQNLLDLQNATLNEGEPLCLNCGDIGCEFCEQIDPLDREYDDEYADAPSDWWPAPHGER